MSVYAEASGALGQSPVVVFVNSAAGGGRARAYLPRIRKLFESFRIPAQFVMTASAAELESSVRDSILQAQPVLLAMGGDGTFQALANAAFGADVVLGVLPVGGGNDFATAQQIVNRMGQPIGLNVISTYPDLPESFPACNHYQPGLVINGDGGEPQILPLKKAKQAA